MRILGIDPGSVTTGYGVVDHHRGNLVLITSGTVRTARGAELPQRLHELWVGLSTLIRDTAPEVVAVEAPFAGRNVKSLIQLAHARGVALLAARAAGLEVVEYAPRAIKSAVVGYGAAEKAQVAHMVAVLLPETRGMKLTEDATDALAVAICHAHSARMRALR